MSAQHETWWEAWLGLLGLGAPPDASVPSGWDLPCCRAADDNTLRGYDYADPRLRDSYRADTDCDC